MSLHFRLLAVWAAALPLAGCALSGRPATAPEALWRFPLIEDGRLVAEGEINGFFAQGEEGLVVFTTRAGRVYAVDAAKRAFRWEFTARAPIERPPLLVKDRLVAVDRDGGVYGLGWDGKVVWETSRKGIIGPGILAVPGKVILCLDGTNIVALETGKGTEAWKLTASAAVRSDFASWPGGIVFGTEDKKIQTASLDGRLLAARDAGGVLVGPMFVAGGVVIANLLDNSIASWDLPSLRKRWSIRLGGIMAAPPAFDGRRIFAVLSNHVLFCVAARTGTTLWWQPLPGRGLYPPALAETHVFATTPSKTLLACPRLGGNRQVAYEAPRENEVRREIGAGPLWLAPHLWIAILEPEAGRTTVVFLKSPPSPVKEKKS